MYNCSIDQNARNILRGDTQSLLKWEHWNYKSRMLDLNARKVSISNKASTYTENYVPITIKASTLFRSASSDRLTLSFRVSPKNVTAGLSTPPQTSDAGLCRFLALWVVSLGDAIVDDTLLVELLLDMLLSFRLSFLCSASCDGYFTDGLQNMIGCYFFLTRTTGSPLQGSVSVNHLFVGHTCDDF